MKQARRRPRSPSSDTASKTGRRLPREAWIALWAALPFGALAAVLMSWERLFPVAPDRLVEVAWTHQCACAGQWMESLRAQGFVVRDHEIDDLSGPRRRWQMPPSSGGCHPASYMGYFIDGHFTAQNLRRIARERPLGVGLRIRDISLDAAHVGEGAVQDLLLVDARGVETSWP